MKQTRSIPGAIRIAGIMLVLMLVAAACGDDSSDAAVDDGGGTTVEETTTPPDDGSDGGDGGASSDGGGTADLGDYPIPAPAGGDVDRIIADEVRSIRYPASDRDAIMEFYRNWLAESNFEEITGPNLIEATGQFTATAFEGTTRYRIIGTVDGSELFLALSATGG